MQLNVKEQQTQVMMKIPCYSAYERIINVHHISVLVARSVLPAEIFLAFIVALLFVSLQACTMSCFPFHFLPLLTHARNWLTTTCSEALDDLLLIQRSLKESRKLRPKKFFYLAELIKI